jgi:hypothetical protein
MNGGQSRSPVHLICQVGVGSAVKQQLHHLSVAVLAGNLERCGAVLQCAALRINFAAC